MNNAVYFIFMLIFVRRVHGNPIFATTLALVKGISFIFFPSSLIWDIKWPSRENAKRHLRHKMNLCKLHHMVVEFLLLVIFLLFDYTMVDFFFIFYLIIRTLLLVDSVLHHYCKNQVSQSPSLLLIIDISSNNPTISH